MNIILFTEEDASEENDIYFFSKNDDRYRHCKKILRLKVADIFKAGLINGDAGIAEILSFTDEQLRFRFTPAQKKPERMHTYPVEVLLGFPRPIQLKRCLKDMATLGVKRIHLVPTELGEASYLKSDLVQSSEMQKFLIEGATQAGSTFVPQTKLYKNLENFFTENSFSANDLKLVFDITENAHELCSFLEDKRNERINNIFLSIGNERGWTDRERKLFRENAFSFCSLGKRILKTETAVTASLAVSLSVLGFWK